MILKGNFRTKRTGALALAAFPFFSDTHQPSLMRLHLDVLGAPFSH
jgi:hypothetical protein